MSHVAVYVQKHRTTSNQNRQTNALLYMLQLLYLHVCTCLCSDLVGFVLQMWSVLVWYEHNFQYLALPSNGERWTSTSVHSLCLALSIVDFNVSAIRFMQEKEKKNISAFFFFCSVLFSSYCKCNRRRLWGEILEQPAAVEDDWKSFSNSGSFHTNDIQQRRNNCTGDLHFNVCRLVEAEDTHTVLTIERKVISKYIVNIIVLKLQIGSEREAADYVAAFTEV